MSDLNIKIEPQMPEPGICIMADAPLLPANRTFTVKVAAESFYRIIESAAAGFTAVIYGMIRRVSRSVCCCCRFFRMAKKLPVKCRMSQLAFAGGLRL